MSGFSPGAPAMPTPFSNPLSRLREWGTPLIEAANRKGHYPRWATASIKAVVVIGMLTVAAAVAMERSAKAQLAQLAQDAAKSASTKAPRQR